MVKKFRTIPFQFEIKIGALFATGALSWIPTSNTSISAAGISFTYLTDDNKIEGNAGESLNDDEKTIIKEIKRLRKMKMAKIKESNPTHSNDEFKGELPMP